MKKSITIKTGLNDYDDGNRSIRNSVQTEALSSIYHPDRKLRIGLKGTYSLERVLGNHKKEKQRNIRFLIRTYRSRYLEDKPWHKPKKEFSLEPGLSTEELYEGYFKKQYEARDNYLKTLEETLKKRINPQKLLQRRLPPLPSGDHGLKQTETLPQLGFKILREPCETSTSVESCLLPRKRETLIHEATIRIEKQKKSKERFKRAFRIIRTVNRWVRAVIQHAAMFHPPPPTQKVTAESIEDAADADVSKSASTVSTKQSVGPVTFDKTIYKIRKEKPVSTLPYDVINVLTMPTVNRCPELIQKGVKYLQSMSAFAEYPRHMQERLVEVGWFETVGPNRVIIRQTHLAENFYFLLSGSVVISVLQKDQITGEGIHKTCTVLKPGSCFGELALLFQSRRTATVTSRDTVTLLTVGRGTFFNIFEEGIANKHHDEHLKFIRNIEFMKDWPIEKLLENPNMCLMHYFKRNQLVAHDGGDYSTQWIYIIKMGSCDVLKNLEDPELYNTTAYDTIKKKAPLSFRLAGKGSEAKTDSRLKRPPQSEDVASVNLDENIDLTSEKSIKNVSYISKIKSTTSDTKSTFPSLSDFEHRPLASNSKGLVTIQRLNARDTFGLANLFFEEDIHDYDTYEVLLVSRGAECFMINKDFFMQFATPQIKKHLRFFVNLFPNPTVIPRMLLDQMKWEKYRQQVIQGVIDGIEKRKMVKKLYHFN